MGPALATDGVGEINQTSALAGGITAGDIAGFPVSLTEAGSYVLTSNLSVSAGTSGIEVGAPGVTIDLNGFTIDGTGAADHGIDLNGHSRVTIKNGQVRDFALAGVYNDNPLANYNRVHDVQVIGNGTAGTGAPNSGIYLAGSFNHVEGCTVDDNGGYGIFVGAGSQLDRNVGSGISGPGCPAVGAGCSASLSLRDTTTVINDLRTAYSSQDWSAYACNYATNAFVLDDQGILVGHLDILAAAQSLSSLFSGVSPQQLQLDVFADTARLLEDYDGGWVTIPDRVRTFVVECGLIVRQSDHGLIVFTGPPPG
jgi:parallel beta-helix repeat protein